LTVYQRFQSLIVLMIIFNWSLLFIDGWNRLVEDDCLRSLRCTLELVACILRRQFESVANWVISAPSALTKRIILMFAHYWQMDNCSNCHDSDLFTLSFPLCQLWSEHLNYQGLRTQTLIDQSPSVLNSKEDDLWRVRKHKKGDGLNYVDFF
jgi:hypothetical protein